MIEIHYTSYQTHYRTTMSNAHAAGMFSLPS